jgi:hypothetical protein
MPYADTSHVLPFADGFNRHQTPVNLAAPLSQVAPRIASLMRAQIDIGTLQNLAPVIVFELFNTAKIESVPSAQTAFRRREWEGMASGGIIYGRDAGKREKGELLQGADEVREEVEEVRRMIREMIAVISGPEPTAGAVGESQGTGQAGRAQEHKITYPSYCKCLEG